MALIKFEIDDSVTPPVVDTSDVLSLHAGDRLLFTTTSANDVLVDLGGDETSSTMVALVKQKCPINFEAIKMADGRVTIRLKPPAGGSGPGPDPP